MASPRLATSGSDDLVACANLSGIAVPRWKPHRTSLKMSAAT